MTRFQAIHQWQNPEHDARTAAEDMVEFNQTSPHTVVRQRWNTETLTGILSFKSQNQLLLTQASQGKPACRMPFVFEWTWHRLQKSMTTAIRRAGCGLGRGGGTFIIWQWWHPLALEAIRPFCGFQRWDINTHKKHTSHATLGAGLFQPIPWPQPVSPC